MSAGRRAVGLGISSWLSSADAGVRPGQLRAPGLPRRRGRHAKGSGGPRGRSGTAASRVSLADQPGRGPVHHRARAGIGEARRVLGSIDQLPLEIVDVSRPTVLAAAHIKARFPIAYADAFAVVAALEHGGVVLTGDPEFRPLARAGLVAVEWLPHRTRG